jgi:hypothetical protein
MTPVRIISFLGIVLSALFLPVWLFALLTLVYAFLFSPYEVLVLAVLVDAQFGDVGLPVWYAYTLVASLVLLFVVYLKPYLRFYK